MFSEHCTPRNLSTSNLALSLLQDKEGIAQTELVSKKVEVMTAGRRKSCYHAASSAERSCVSACAARNRMYLCGPAEITSAFKTNGSLEQPESAAVVRFISSTFLPSDLNTRQYAANLMLTRSISVGPD